MAQEGYVGVALDGAGKKIRNLQLQVVQSDGSQATVLMQVVSLADENGNPLAFADQYDFQVQMLDEIRAVRLGLQQLIDDQSQDDLLEQAQAYRNAQDT